MTNKINRHERFVITKPVDFYLEDGLGWLDARVDGAKAYILLSPAAAILTVSLIQKRLAGRVLPWRNIPPD